MMKRKYVRIIRKVQEKEEVKGVLEKETSIAESGRGEKGESGTLGVDQTGYRQIVIKTKTITFYNIS